MTNDYQFVLELLRPDGEPLERVPLTPDWEPAIECARLGRLRALGDWVAAPEAVREVEPLWHADSGEPHVSGFRVRIAPPGGRDWCADFPAQAYFAETARDAGARLVKAGTMAAGDRLLYRAAAFARSVNGIDAPALRFDATDRPPPLTLREAELDSLLASATTHGKHHADDIEVLMPRRTLDEAVDQTKAAGDRETGGILIGHLHRDPGTFEIFAQVTAQIPARHTAGDALKLTFTSDTWTDVRGALALRRRDEIMLGWWHSHPAVAWCRACPPERQRECHMATGFLSSDDTALHRAMFPRAFTLALVMTHTLDGVAPALFGWRSGVLQPRAFRVLPDNISS